MAYSQGDAGQSVGEFLRSTIGGASPMGSWTGLHPLLGAPASGALLGAGVGALYGGYKKLTADPNNPEEADQPTIGRRSLIGALLGGAVGLGSGAMQTYLPPPYSQPMHSGDEKVAFARSAVSPEEVALILSRDHNLSYADKQRIMQALAGASPTQWSNLLAMAAGGTLTGYAASRILGVGLIGTMLAAGAGALIARNMFGGQPKTFV